MLVLSALIMATLTAPEEIGTNPQSMVWLLPIAAAITVIYKATKLETIEANVFFKEVVALFGSIVVFLIIVALALYAFTWLVIE